MVENPMLHDEIESSVRNDMKIRCNRRVSDLLRSMNYLISFDGEKNAVGMAVISFG